MATDKALFEVLKQKYLTYSKQEFATQQQRDCELGRFGMIGYLYFTPDIHVKLP